MNYLQKMQTLRFQAPFSRCAQNQRHELDATRNAMFVHAFIASNERNCANVSTCQAYCIPLTLEIKLASGNVVEIPAPTADRLVFIQFNADGALLPTVGEVHDIHEYGLTYHKLMSNKTWKPYRSALCLEPSSFKWNPALVETIKIVNLEDPPPRSWSYSSLDNRFDIINERAKRKKQDARATAGDGGGGDRFKLTLHFQ